MFKRIQILIVFAFAFVALPAQREGGRGGIFGDGYSYFCGKFSAPNGRREAAVCRMEQRLRGLVGWGPRLSFD